MKHDTIKRMNNKIFSRILVPRSVKIYLTNKKQGITAQTRLPLLAPNNKNRIHNTKAIKDRILFLTHNIKGKRNKKTVPELFVTSSSLLPCKSVATRNPSIK